MSITDPQRRRGLSCQVGLSKLGVEAMLWAEELAEHDDSGGVQALLELCRVEWSSLEGSRNQRLCLDLGILKEIFENEITLNLSEKQTSHGD